MRILLLILLLVAGIAGADPQPSTTPTWEAVMRSAFDKAEAGEYQSIVDRMLGPTFIDRLKAKHGAEAWKAAILKRLETLPYHYRKLKNQRRIVESPEKTMVYGEYDCWAEFIKTPEGFLIGDFGQEITSM